VEFDDLRQILECFYDRLMVGFGSRHLPTVSPATVEDTMRIFSTILCGGAAIVLLSGCVGDRGYGHNRDSYRGYSSSHSGGGYYDGYYGPYSGGYWANDGYFYYLDQNRNYRRDDGRHFRRDRFQGSSPIQADDRGRAHDRDSNRSSRDRQDNHGGRDRNSSDW
jgi:hypothetical protein